MQLNQTSPRTAITLLVFFFRLASALHGQSELFLDFARADAAFVEQLQVEGVTITASRNGGPARIARVPGCGIGVEGGPTAGINPGETLTFAFDGFCASEVIYMVEGASDLLGDGRFGEVLIEPIDLTGEAFPARKTHGATRTHLQRVTGAPGCGPVAGFSVQASPCSSEEEHWIANLELNVILSNYVIDFTALGNHEASMFMVGDVVIAADTTPGGSSRLSIREGCGLSVFQAANGEVHPGSAGNERLILQFMSTPSGISLVNREGEAGAVAGATGEVTLTPMDGTRNLGFAASRASGSGPHHVSTSTRRVTCDKLVIESEHASGGGFLITRLAYCQPRGPQPSHLGEKARMNRVPEIVMHQPVQGE